MRRHQLRAHVATTTRLWKAWQPFGRPILAAITATIDRLLAPVRDTSKQDRRRNGISTPLRKSIPMQKFADWNDLAPGLFEMEMVAHLRVVLTDIAIADQIK